MGGWRGVGEGREGRGRGGGSRSRSSWCPMEGCVLFLALSHTAVRMDCVFESAWRVLMKEAWRLLPSVPTRLSTTTLLDPPSEPQSVALSPAHR